MKYGDGTELSLFRKIGNELFRESAGDRDVISRTSDFVNFVAVPADGDVGVVAYGVGDDDGENLLLDEDDVKQFNKFEFAFEFEVFSNGLFLLLLFATNNLLLLCKFSHLFSLNQGLFIDPFVEYVDKADDADDDEETTDVGTDINFLLAAELCEYCCIFPTDVCDCGVGGSGGGGAGVANMGGCSECNICGCWSEDGSTVIIFVFNGDEDEDGDLTTTLLHPTLEFNPKFISFEFFFKFF